MARVLIVAPYAASIVPFRGDLIRELVSRGHEVSAAAPEPGFEEALGALGARYSRIPLARTGRNPIADALALGALVRVMRRLRPEVLLSYALKPVIYGSIAARIARVPRVYSMVTGLGSLFVEGERRPRALAIIARSLYKAALRKNRAVIFLNPDDLKFFEERRLLSPKCERVLVGGSGVNLERFRQAPPPSGPPKFLLVARLLRHKGIVEYVEAARALKRRHGCTSFQLLGPFDTNPSALREAEVRAWHAEGAIEYLGVTDDVYPYLVACSVCVLPSYREGTPRSVLEAMAVGRPIVTTDAPGCRETVVDGLNGFLVPPRDSRALAAAMERFILEPERIPEMGKKSRQIAEEKFDVRKVNATILRALGMS